MQNSETNNPSGAVTTPTKEETTTATEQTTSTSKKETSASTEKANLPTVVTPTEKAKEKDPIVLKNLDLDFTYDVMSVPTCSSEEYRMVTFITLWAMRNNIDFEFDSYGNLYLTKGEVAQGQFYPCVTSHLDTVQHKQEPYAKAGCTLDLQMRKKSADKHELYVNGMGIGADCKTGILICLSLFKHFDAIKAAFFLEEEIGMKGSANLNADWFKNVGYVIGWDSPELNRAAWSCSGTKLMDKEFFENKIQDVCKKHGLTTFNAEPYTDVKHIREKTELICMNFGNGGYEAHWQTEYMVIEETDKALTMGIDLIKKLGTAQYKLAHTTKSYAWVLGSDGTYHKPDEDKDEVFFRKLSGGFGRRCYGGYDDDDYGYGGAYNHGTAYKPTTTHTTTQTPSTKTPSSTSTTPPTSGSAVTEDCVSAEAVQYIAEKYEERIVDIKTEIEKRCKELNIDFNDAFASIFEAKISF